MRGPHLNGILATEGSFTLSLQRRAQGKCHLCDRDPLYCLGAVVEILW